MANLTRWDPFREMLTFRRAMNRMMEDPFFDQGLEWERTMDVPLDVEDNEDEFIVKASLPGINPDDLDITYNNNLLTIRGEMKSDQEQKDKNYIVQERHFGSFQRSVTLPNTVDADHIQASYQDGVLTLQLPKKEETKPRRIQIQSGGGKKVIEAHSQASKKSGR